MYWMCSRCAFQAEGVQEVPGRRRLALYVGGSVRRSVWLEQISDEESCNCLALGGRRRERRDTNIGKSHECEAKESLGLKEILDV